ncbi:tetratricopeptide repeat protein [Paenibacillus sp. GCM10023250]|uniref:tetratricopeptide repeat protein n=1 Tax=Paenibacillus sp. GCM10023250 TaxID=3252648 RepID=UPI00361E3343
MTHTKLQRAIALREQGEPEAAMRLLEDVVRKEPGHAQAWYQLAWVHDVLGLEREAVPHYERALRCGLAGEDRAGALLGLGSTLRTLGRYEESLVLFEEAVREYPGRREFQTFRAMTLHNLNRHAEAMAILLSQLAETSGDSGIAAYRNAIGFYADQLDRVWEAGAEEAAGTITLRKGVQEHPREEEKRTMDLPKPEPALSAEESGYVRNRLIAYNASRLPEAYRDRYEEINLVQREADGRIIGGVLSVCCWNWLEIDILWVDDAYRGRGVGSALLEAAEREARKRDCAFVKLNTFSFQAPAFYARHGYAELAVIEDAPAGHRHYYFIKPLRHEGDNRS